MVHLPLIELLVMIFIIIDIVEIRYEIGYCSVDQVSYMFNVYHYPLYNTTWRDGCL